MDRRQVASAIREFFAPHIAAMKTIEVGDDTNLVEIGLLDSLLVVEFVAFLEDRFGIGLTDDDLMSEALASITGASGIVASKTESRG